MSFGILVIASGLITAIVWLHLRGKAEEREWRRFLSSFTTEHAEQRAAP